jgi:aminopeptidase N
MKTISNMPLKNSISLRSNGDEYELDVYEETEKMSTYLLAFVVADFELREGVKTENNVTFRIWSRPEVKSQTKYAAETGPLILEYYENYFDVKFPLPKQDMIALPDFGAGAMENWGLITYREEYLLYEEGVSSLMSKEGVASVMAHELAHQWFGDLVTMDWWTE